MTAAPGSLLERIGNTPLLRAARLRGVPKSVEVWAKAEWFNPGGSVKDRPILRMIEAAERDGRLSLGRTLLDSTSGNAGIAYAMIGAVKGYRVELAVPENVSEERKRIIRAYGAQIHYSDPLEGSDGAILLARARLAADPDRYLMLDQYNNPANWRAHYEGTGREILAQTDGRVTHFVAGLGTSGTVMGVGRRLREEAPEVRVVAVEPDGPLHGLEGLKHMASSIVPGIYDPAVPHRVMAVQTEAAYEMTRRLAAEEGWLVGPSAGAAMSAALRLADEVGTGVVVVVLPDGGDRYLSTQLFARPIALTLSRGQYEEIVAHARDEFPNECCGLLAGKGGQVQRVYRGRNADASPYTYRLDDRQLFQFHKEMDEAGLELLGIYHSHTASEAAPSRTDVARAYYPEAAYIIISLRDQDRPEVRGFRITDGRVTEEDVVVR